MKNMIFSKSNRSANDTHSKSIGPNATRPRRGRCEARRVGAGQAAGTARLGAGPDGSAAGAHGARAAGSPAAAPEGRILPGRRLQYVVPPLPAFPRTPHGTAARPLRVCHGARRGEGASRPGEGDRLVHAALRVAAAAVPRLAGTGTVEGWDKTVRSCSHGRISILQRPLFSCLQHLLCKLHNNSFVKFGMIRISSRYWTFSWKADVVHKVSKY